MNSPGWPSTHYVAGNDLDLLTSFVVMGLLACPTVSSFSEVLGIELPIEWDLGHQYTDF